MSSFRPAFILILALAIVGAAAIPAPAARRRAGRPAVLPDAVFAAALEAGFNPEPLRRLLLQVRNPNAKDRRGNSALAYAVLSGDADLVSRLLRRGADPNQKTSAGRTALHWVSYYREDAWPVVALLLKHGARPDVPNSTGATPLMLACDAPHVRAALGLLSSGADVHARDHEGATPLYYAVRTDTPELVSALLRRGARINVTTKDGAMPLDRAVTVGASQTVQLLLSRGARIRWEGEYGVPLFHSAVASGSPAIVRALLQRGANPNEASPGGQPPLMDAVAGGSVEVVALLLEKGVDPNVAGESGITALMQAAQSGNAELVGLLLKHGADPDRKSTEGETALRIAKLSPLGVDEETIRLLKEAGATDPGLSLAEAVRTQNLEDVKSALARGEDPNRKAPVEDPFAMFAAMFERLPGMLGAEEPGEGIEKLFETLSKEGLPLIYLAISRSQGDPEIVKSLLQSGAEVNVVDPFGSTPLHIAAVSGSEALIELLVKAGAKVEAPDRGGNTPLLAAVLSRNVSAVRKLLALGGNPRARNQGKLGVFEIALAPVREQEEISAELLITLVEGGADPNSPGPRGITPLMVAIVRPGGDEEAPDLQEEAAAPDPAQSDADLAIAAVRKGSRKLLQDALRAAATGKTPSNDSDLGRAAEEAAERLPDGVRGKLEALGGKLLEALSAPTWTRLEAVEYLLSKGADPNAEAEEGHTVASAAVYASGERGYPESRLLRLLVAHGMQLNRLISGEGTPLVQAIAGGDAALVNTLLWLGANPNFPEGHSAIHAAIASHDSEIVRLLLRHGADANRLYEGLSPLLLAAGYGDLDAIRMLLGRGADPNQGSPGGMTPLHAAAESGATEAVKLLLRRGANPNRRYRGVTPLFLAAAQGHLESVRLLLARGADPNLRSSDGISPLRAAANARQNQIVRFLKQAGARK